MRKKELKLVITFHTTADAIPRAITAGCGLAWCVGLGCKEAIKEVLQKAGIDEEALHECMV